MKRQDYWQRRLAGFQALVHKAADGDPDPLIRFFEDGPRQLSEQDGMALAWLLDKLPRKSLGGRPPGLLKPRNAALKYAKHLLQVATRAWCVKHNKKRASNKALRETWGKHAIELAKREFPQADISYQDLKDYELKSTDRVEDFVREEVLPEAKFEMKQLALNNPPETRG